MPNKRPSTLEIEPLLTDYLAKPGNAMGGALNLFVDGGHAMEDDISFCRQRAIDTGDLDGMRLADLLLLMTVTQRTVLQKRVAQGRFMRIASALARIEADPNANSKTAQEARALKGVVDTAELIRRALRLKF
jgi:hypothetical protein